MKKFKFIGTDIVIKTERVFYRYSTSKLFRQSWIARFNNEAIITLGV